MKISRVETFKDLDVWKLSMQLTKDLYSISGRFPKDEVYGLTSQMRRAGLSVPLNIAEGAGRNSTASYISFLNIANGSLYELMTILELAKDLNYLENEEFDKLNFTSIRIAQMLNRLKTSLKNKLEQDRKVKNEKRITNYE